MKKSKSDNDARFHYEWCFALVRCYWRNKGPDPLFDRVYRRSAEFMQRWYPDIWDLALDSYHTRQRHAR